MENLKIPKDKLPWYKDAKAVILPIVGAITSGCW